MAAGRRRSGGPAGGPQTARRAGGRAGELAAPFRHPLHPALAHLPIGAWTCSLLFDIGSRLVSRPAGLAEGSAWLIAVGVLGALPAAVAGVADMRWIRPGSPASRTASAHMALNVSLIFAYAVDFAWRYRSHALRVPVSMGALAFSAVCVAVLGVSGFLGGRLAYGHGVRVAGRAETGGPGVRRP